MARSLTSIIQEQIDDRDIKVNYIFKINNTDYTDYLISQSTSFDVKFGSAVGTFELDNNDGEFGDGGSRGIKVGDVVELIEKFEGDSTEFKKFYGLVNKRSIVKRSNSRHIVLSCLDYISSLQNLDIDLVVEGTKQDVTGEILDPVYLDPPNDSLAQIFNFANNSIATDPLPIIIIRDQNHSNNDETKYDGFEIMYSTGQVKFGNPINALYNYQVISNYSYYTKGIYAEDALEKILTLADGYGKYLFGESSAQNVIDNHLKSTFYDEEGTNTDVLTYNTSNVDVDIETTLTADVSEGDTSITVASTEGFPSSGQASINGDIFSYTGIENENTLIGIPSSGSYSLKNHRAGDYVTYTKTCSVGQLWFLSYNNITTTLTSSDFTLPSGTSIYYIDLRYGRIILDNAISISSVVTCNTNYSFKTLQSTAIELNKMIFRSRELNNRFEAIRKVKEYLAPNYIIFTQGDNKIWGKYMSQKLSQDYDLKLVESLDYQEDEDLYTRVIMRAKNKQPTNLMFGEDVDYTSETESSYTGTASKTELSYFGEEKSGILSEWAQGQLSEAELLHQTSLQDLINFVNDKYIKKDNATQPSTGFHIYGTTLTSVGKIILGDVEPIVYINNVPVDNKVHQQVGVPIKVRMTQTTTSRGGGKSKSVSVNTYYYYEVIFPHASLVPSEEIKLYDNQGVLRYTISPNDPNVDYANGIWTIPGIERNDVAEILSTATYYVLYSSGDIKIEYDDAVIKINKRLLPEPTTVTVTASFEYWSIAIGVRDIRNVVDGRSDTQLQLEFFGEPPAGFHLATIDLGQTYNIQAIDIVGGFYRPDNTRKFDISFRLSMKYSTDGTNFYAISDKTENFDVRGGQAISFEEEDLGSGFQARYLKFNLEGVDKINYGKGRYVIAIAEISVYKDIIIESEAKLIPTTTLTADVSASDTTIYVNSTEGFEEPTSGSPVTAYLSKDSDKSFTYTGLTDTSFTGCTISSEISASNGDYVTQEIEGDTTLYDDEGMLRNLGDRVKKVNKISDRNLFLQSEIDTLAKLYLREYYKDHTKLKTSIVYAPYLKVGQTVKLIDSYNNKSTLYFIEKVSDTNNRYSLVLARYP